MYRPEIKVIDCTVRDGGLMNKWQFEDRFVKTVYEATAAAGVDYMEIGYFSSESAFSRKEYGAWKFCAENDLQRIIGKEPKKIKLAAMADIGRINFEDIPTKDKSSLDLVRVACYAHQVDAAIELAHHVMDKGYESTINLMAVSTVGGRELDEALNDLAKSRVPVIYVVDSYGAYYQEDIDHLVKQYQKALPGKTIGVHMHNNQQLAFANTIAGIIAGANYLDATLYGFGRGAGNCPLELLISFLKNPKFKLRPLVGAIDEVVLPWFRKIEWGYSIPYMIGGTLNQHPREAMAKMDREDRDRVLEFYDRVASLPE